ncbi:MAG: polysaccharide pyruvyl transferase family protein [Parachlamydiaceae bacterium]
MLKILCLTLSSLLFFVLPASGTETFGYISASTINIGDDIQTIAAKRLLPKKSVAVDRELISEFSYRTPVKTLVSGWFMHHEGGYWDLPIPPPARSWPPAPAIDPFFISIHLTGTFLPIVFSDNNIEYLRKHSPIGARDLFTLNELQKRGIPSYFSGCLTLTLENKCRTRNNLIYLVDLDQETVDYIKSRTSSPVVVLTHGRALLGLLTVEHRLKYAEFLLNLYRKCKCVVTTRLHAAMPCLAFETPMFMVSSNRRGSMDSRFIGLIEHTWHGSKEELLNGEIDYDFDYPPENPKTYLPIRENLIKNVTEWVQRNK